MSEDIINYIHQARSYGHSDDEIGHNLLTVGWDAQAIEAGFRAIKAEELPPPVTIPPPAVLTLEPLALPQRNKAIKKWLIVGGISILIIFCMVFYASAAYNPQRIFNRFLDKNFSQAYQTNFSLDYVDGGEAQLPEILGLTLKDLALQISGSSQINASDANLSKSQSKIHFAAGAAGNDFTTDFSYRQIGSDIYFSAQDNPFLQNLLSQSSGKQSDWAKINLDQLTQQTENTETSELARKILDTVFQEKLTALWTSRKIVKLEKYLGTEQINNTWTFHFRLSLDRANIATAMNDTAAALSEAEPRAIPKDSLPVFSSAVNDFMGSWEIKEFEVWVGIFDPRLYRIHFVSNAPSLVSILELWSSDLQTQLIDPADQDSKRLADIRDITTVLELYYNDSGGYPENLQTLLIAPSGKLPYVEAIPVAPPPGGRCTDAANGYTYSPTGSTITGKKEGKVYPNYRVTSCLGNDVGNYKAGLIAATPSGIANVEQCPPDLPNCLLPTSRDEQSADSQTQQIFDRIGYSAQIKFDINYADFDKPISIDPPADFIDLNELNETQ